jgi:hypothetical protein
MTSNKKSRHTKNVQNFLIKIIGCKGIPFVGKGRWCWCEEGRKISNVAGDKRLKRLQISKVSDAGGVWTFWLISSWSCWTFSGSLILILPRSNLKIPQAIVGNYGFSSKVFRILKPLFYLKEARKVVNFNPLALKMKLSHELKNISIFFCLSVNFYLFFLNL